MKPGDKNMQNEIDNAIAELQAAQENFNCALVKVALGGGEDLESTIKTQLGIIVPLAEAVAVHMAFQSLEDALLGAAAEVANELKIFQK